MQILQAEILEGLSETQIADLSSACAWRAYPSGRLILGYQDATDSVLFIQGGSCRVTLFSPSGRQAIYRDFPAGELLAEISAIDCLHRSGSAEVVVISDCLMAAMPAARFRQLLCESPHAMWWKLKRLAGLVRNLTNRQLELATMPLRYRLCAHLLLLAQDRPDATEDWMDVSLARHHELAGQLGGHREAVTKALTLIEKDAAMRKAGLIARTKRRRPPFDTGERNVIASNVLDCRFDADGPNRK